MEKLKIREVGAMRSILGETEEHLLKLKVPEKTESYTPVSHKFILETIYEQLEKKELEVLGKFFRTSNGGNRIMAQIQVVPKGEKRDYVFDSLIRVIAFRNSYDKSMSFGTGSGAHVFICSNGVFSSEMSYIKKHLGDVDVQAGIQIIKAFDYLEETYKKLKEFKEALKTIELTKRVQAELLGRMIFENKILQSTQINIIKDQRKDSKFFTEDNAWHVFNNITESLKQTNPVEFYKNHLIVFNMFSELY